MRDLHVELPRWRKFSSLASFITCAILLVIPTAGAAADSPSLCALRSGPDGPCTCRIEGDGAGQFTVVPRSRCRKGATPSKAKANAPADDETAETTASESKPEKPAAEPAPRQAKEIATPAAEPQPPEKKPGDAAEATTSTAPEPVATGALPTAQTKLDIVRTRGKLVCGVNEKLLGFSYRSSNGEWAGLDADYCRALAAAVLGDASKVEFVPLDATNRFEALKTSKIDVLSRNTTWTMARNVDLGLDFAGVIYFDGQGFMTSDNRGLVSAQQLAGTKVCVQQATTTETNMAYYFKDHNVSVETKTFQSRDALVKAYLAGECEAYSADRSALFADRAGFDKPEEHAVLPEVISKEPLGPAVIRGDAEWTEIVRWVLAGLINAEEVGLDREAAAGNTELAGDAKRLVEGAGSSGEKLRLDRNWLRTAVAAVGNYGEAFESNIGRSGALGMERGINALWKQGGLLYAPPMW